MKAKRKQIRGPKLPCPRGCERLTDGVHRLCDVCRGKTSGLGNAGRTGRKPRRAAKRCWACEGQPWRRAREGCPVCRQPYSPELSLDGTEKRTPRRASR